MVPSQNMQSYCNKTHFTYNLVWAIWVYSGKGNHAHVKEQVKLHFALGIGGLGISNLQNLNWALKMRWIWLQKTWLTTLVCIRNSSSWLCLGLIFHGRLAVVSEVGNVTSTLFWTDRWLHGQCIADLAPRLSSLVPKRTYKRTVQEAHMNYC